MGIRQAIIPAAGEGRRLFPLTQLFPKALLPVGRLPAAEYVVRELRAAGVDRFLFGVGSLPSAVEEYFQDGRRWDIDCAYLVQNPAAPPRGVGGGILRARDWVGDEPFFVYSPTCLMFSRGSMFPEGPASPTQRLAATHTQSGAAISLLVERVTDGAGIPTALLPFDFTADPDCQGTVQSLTTVPIGFPSAVGRWAYSPEAFDYIARTAPAEDGETRPPDIAHTAIKAGGLVRGVPLLPHEARHYIGTWREYLTTVAIAACSDEEFGADVQAASPLQNQPH